jgi:hypothetical protein
LSNESTTGLICQELGIRERTFHRRPHSELAPVIYGVWNSLVLIAIAADYLWLASKETPLLAESAQKLVLSSAQENRSIP